MSSKRRYITEGVTANRHCIDEGSHHVVYANSRTLVMEFVIEIHTGNGSHY